MHSDKLFNPYVFRGYAPLIIDSQTGIYIWIDFDFDAGNLNYDVFGLGNVLLQAVGKGRHSLYDIRLRPSDYPDFKSTLVPNDMSLMYPHRIANLRKLYPHISEDLNAILMRFSVGAPDPYKNVDSLVKDLRFIFSTEGCNASLALYNEKKGGQNESKCIDRLLFNVWSRI